MSDRSNVLSHLLSDAIRHHAAADRLALIGADWTLSYSELGGMIDRYAGGIHAWTKEPGALIGFLAPRSADAVAAYLGAMQCGACPCFLEPRLAVDALAERLAAVGINNLVMTGEATRSFKPLERLGVNMRPLGSLATGPAYSSDYLKPQDRAMLLFTSGSTGRPKGILLSQANLVCNAEGVIDRTDITPDDRLLHVMPLHHTNGINNQLIAPLLAGASIVLTEKFQPEAIVGQIEEFTPTYVTGVSTMFSRILTSAPGPCALKSLRFLRCGSAPITAALHEQVEEAFGVPLCVSYGLSEATCTNTMNPPRARKIGTVGTTMPNQTVKLLAPDTDVEPPPGQEGEVCIAGAALMKGYVEAGIEQTLTDPWLRTGDLGTFDADGYLAITGRIKDVIVRAGENLSPRLIEREINSHPAVQACSVVGAPDGDLGEVPVAFVVQRGGSRVTEQALGDHVLDRLSRIYVPAAFVFIDAIPETSVGKPDHKALREMAEVER